MPAQQVTLGLAPIIDSVTINGIAYPNPTPGTPGGTIVVPAADAATLFNQSAQLSPRGIWLVSSTAT